MKKIKFIPAIYILIFTVCSLFFLSCKDDNPVVSSEDPYQFDSSRYEWKTDVIYNSILFNAFALDSSNLFLLGQSELIYFNGNNYNRIFMGADITPLVAGGTYNNIYIGGYNNNLNSIQPKLKKWDGYLFTDIILPAEIKGTISSIFYVALNDIWFGTKKGEIMRYDGSNFKIINTDTTFSIYNFGVENNNFYFMSKKDSIDLNAKTGKLFSRIGKIFDNKWKIVYDRVFDLYDADNVIFAKILNRKILAGNLNAIYSFNGEDFDNILDIKKIQT